MSIPRVLGVLQLVLFALGAAMLLPLGLCLWPLDVDSARGFGFGIAACVVLGLSFRVAGDREGQLYRRDGVVIVVGSWVLASLLGAIPYAASGAIPGLVDAFFESASGFTTTGASILTDVEAMPSSMLFWRSQTQWLGGIGIVVLFVALLAELGPGVRFLLDLETPGPKAEILRARARQTAFVLFRIYLALTAMQCVLLFAFGASAYDAVVHSFSTMSTGGFSPYNDSVAHFSRPLQAIVLVFMLFAGVNFSLYGGLIRSRSLEALRDIEFRVYLAIAASSILLVSLSNATDSSPSAGAVFDAAFQVVSVVTTTGFATADFADWPDLSRAVLVGLMFAGACAGSTSGGAKIVRLLIAWQAAIREVRVTFSPHSVVAVTLGKKAVPEASIRAVVALLLLWVLGWGVGAVLLAIGPADIVTAATASIATLSNIGPGLEAVGPTGNFAFFAPWQKLLMVFLMWLGRLEFFAVVALLLPRFWRH